MQPNQPGNDTGSPSPSRFFRDVSVQVTSNLITVAVLFLAGAAAGLLPTTFVATTVAGVLLYLTFLFFIASRFFRDQRRFVVSGSGLVAGGLAGHSNKSAWVPVRPRSSLPPCFR